MNTPADGHASRDGGDGEPHGLHGRVAVVTGAGRGIGAAIAHALAASGASVMLAARSADEIELVAAAIRDAGGDADAVVCDVASEESVENLAARTLTRFGHADILVNNAGVGHSALLHRTTLEDWRRVMDINATGAFLCMRAFLPGMTQRDWGRIINVASVAGLSAQRYIAAYAASKHAMIGLTRAGAAEAAGTGVTINAICPGFADTPMTDATVANVVKQTGRSEADALELVLSSADQQRLVTPEEIADAVIWLCEGEAASISGEAIVMDGREQ